MASKTVNPKEVSVGEENTGLGLIVEEFSEPRSQVRLKVTTPVETCQQLWERAVDTLRNSSQEFASEKKTDKPLSDAIITKLVGEKEVKKVALEILLQESPREVFVPYQNRLLQGSEKFLQNGDEMVASFSKTVPFVFEVRFDVEPEVRWKSERAYSGLQMDVKMDIPNPEEEADRELQSLLKDQGSLRVSVNPDGLQKGDVAIMDVSAARVLEDGTAGDPIISCVEKGCQIDTDNLMSTYLPGLVEGMWGMNRDETREYDLVFPTDWSIDALQGITGRFTVTCKELFIREVPELDDSIAPKLMSGVSTVKEARDALVSKHQKRIDEAKEQAATTEILRVLGEVCEVDVPETLISQQGQNQFALYLTSIQAKLRLSQEQLKLLTTQKAMDAFIQDRREYLEGAMKQSCAMESIYKLEPETQVADEELEAELASHLSMFDKSEVYDSLQVPSKGSKEEGNRLFDKEKLREQAFIVLKERKVLKWIKDRAQINYVLQA